MTIKRSPITSCYRLFVFLPAASDALTNQPILEIVHLLNGFHAYNYEVEPYIGQRFPSNPMYDLILIDKAIKSPLLLSIVLKKFPLHRV